MKKLLLFAFAACALAACSDDDGDSRVPATAVVLDCTEKELAVGETLQLTATPAPANTTDDVVWSSDAEEFATVSESGLVTAVAAGTAKISATLRFGVGNLYRACERTRSGTRSGPQSRSGAGTV